MRKDMFIAVTNREYKGIQGYEIIAISNDKEKVIKAFGEWRKDRLNEFASEIEENGDVIEVEDASMSFLYNDNNRYYITGYVGECPCDLFLKNEAFVALVGGLSDGNDIEDYKAFATSQEAIKWMKDQIFNVKKEWEKDRTEISWDMEEREDSIELSSNDVSVEVFGYVTKMEVL